MDKPIKYDEFDHLPVHPVVRAPRLVHDRHLGPLNASSWKAFHRAAQLWRITNQNISDTVTGEESDDAATAMDNSDNDFSIVSCDCCEQPVSLPFWICVTCSIHHRMFLMRRCYYSNGCVICLETDVIICTDCDIRRRYKYGFTKHKDYHPLVRFQYMEPTAEPEFTSLETKLLALETTINERLDRLEKRNADQDVTNGDRFDRSEMSMDRRIAELEVYVGGRFDTIETLLRALATKIGGQ
jgi:uncharacterized coiled-coil protein SlyX